MRRQGRYRLAPFREDLGRASGVGATQNRAAEMVQDDGRLRELRGQRCDFTQLRMIDPGIESETETSQASKALAEFTLGEYSRPRDGFVHAFIRIPRR